MDRKMIQSLIDKDATLSHYGIKGQEWGKRRFQNEDGSLTPEGRKRYGLNPNYSELSDQDLRDAINRKRTLNQYMDLKTEHVRKKRSEKEGLIRALAITGNAAINLGTTGLDMRNEKYISENRKRIDELSELGKTTTLSKANADELNIRKEYNATLGDSLRLNKDVRNTSKKMSDVISSKAGDISNFSTKGELNRAVKEAKEMTTELNEKDLQKTVNRMLLEKQYDELVNPPRPSKIEIGREVVQSIGSILGLALTGIMIVQGVKKLIKHSDNDFNYLAHYGVKGMKKGERRYQNEDGSLTPEGYRHYGIDPNGRQANEQNEALMRQRAQQKIREEEIKFQRRADAGGARYARRQAILDAKNEARINSIYNRNLRRSESEMHKIEVEKEKNLYRDKKIKDQNMRKRLKRNRGLAIRLIVFSAAIITASIAVGRRLVRGKSIRSNSAKGAAEAAKAARSFLSK